MAAIYIVLLIANFVRRFYGYPQSNQTNHEIAAGIIGYIRQAALGEALVPFEQRVANGMQKIYSPHNWTAVQRK